MRCKYCFANDFVDPDKGGIPNPKKMIDPDDFKEIVEFILRTGGRVGLLGGEPTLHPKIGEMLSHLITEERVKAVTIFTNGVYLERVADKVAHPKVRLLVNLNSPSDIGEGPYGKIIENLDRIHSLGHGEKFLFGINMYKPGFEYDYLIDVLKRYDKINVRVAIVGPNSDEMRSNSYLDYCRKMKSSVLEFFGKLRSLEIYPRFDCSGNVFPPCVLTRDEREFMEDFNDAVRTAFLRAGGEERSLRRVANLASFPKCEPVIDFTIDKKAIRCFPMYGEKVDMADFGDMREIATYFKSKQDAFKYLIPIDDNCKDCRHMKTTACQGGCIAYRMKEMGRLRKEVEGSGRF